MRADRQRLTYLNAILTVNAVVVAALVWTNVVGDPTASTAYAAPQSTSRSGETLGVPDAGLQQLKIYEELKALRLDVERLLTFVNGGKMKVLLGNPGDIKLDIDYIKLRDVMKPQQQPQQPISPPVAQPTPQQPPQQPPQP
ncbi:MAG: hypothetical protein SGJ09_07710 [Phycisphaerae bacterium]|nr:hypothetical protein [Phycisphaerae bacterium]